MTKYRIAIKEARVRGKVLVEVFCDDGFVGRTDVWLRRNARTAGVKLIKEN